MLVKITNKCSMGCSHCSEDSTPSGEYMSKEIFLEALEFIHKLEPAFLNGVPPMVYLSGGECTEHPEIIDFISEAYKADMFPVLLSNGLFLSNKELRKSILRPEWPKLFIQVTNDSRFYPRKPPRVSDARICYIDSLQIMAPFGRYIGKTSGVPSRTTPTCYNLRSFTRFAFSIGRCSLAIAISALHSRGFACTPSISADGSVRAGETRNCFRIGDVSSTSEALAYAILGMECDRCGLTNRLSIEHKQAIGLLP